MRISPPLFLLLSLLSPQTWDLKSAHLLPPSSGPAMLLPKPHPASHTDTYLGLSDHSLPQIPQRPLCTRPFFFQTLFLPDSYPSLGCAPPHLECLTSLTPEVSGFNLGLCPSHSKWASQVSPTLHPTGPVSSSCVCSFISQETGAQ